LVAAAHPEGAAQEAGHDEETGGEHRMQREDAEVEPQQLGVAQHRAEERRHGLRLAVDAQPAGRRDHEQRDGDADHRQGGHQPEDAGDADPAGDRGSGHDGDEEGKADRHTHQRHRLRAALLRREIGHQREDHRAYRARALQHPSPDDSVDRARARRDGAAEPEYHEPEDDHDLAPDAVREQPEGHLQQTLTQAVDAEREPDLKRSRARELAPEGREHRVDHEKTQHAHREHPRQRSGGTKLLPLHPRVQRTRWSLMTAIELTGWAPAAPAALPVAAAALRLPPGPRGVSSRCKAHSSVSTYTKASGTMAASPGNGCSRKATGSASAAAPPSRPWPDSADITSCTRRASSSWPVASPSRWSSS